MAQQVILTVGCPGSGKTTFARSLNPEAWLTLRFDDFRAALWGSKKIYHRLVDTDARPETEHAMKSALHNVYFSALRAGLLAGWNVCLANTHIDQKTTRRGLGLMRRLGLNPSLRVYLVPLEELLRRNELRPAEDRCDPAYIAATYERMHAQDAWWRHWRGPLEIIRHEYEGGVADLVKLPEVANA